MTVVEPGRDWWWAWSRFKDFDERFVDIVAFRAADLSKAGHRRGREWTVDARCASAARVSRARHVHLPTGFR